MNAYTPCTLLTFISVTGDWYTVHVICIMLVHNQCKKIRLL